MGKVISEATTVNLAVEVTGGTAPSSDWVQVEPNPGGIQDWVIKGQFVERDPLSVYATMEKGELVGIDCEPKLIDDLTKDLVDIIATSIFRSVAKHAGNKGQSLYRPTAITSTGYTVAALGDLTAGLLIHAKGFPTTANNGLKVVGSSSTGMEIKTSGLTAESLDALRGGTVEVAGVQGASADITLDSSGNLTSTLLDFTTLGLNVGQTIKIGDGGSGTSFATALYNGRARISGAITANLIPLEHRTWTPASADLGTGKTIRLLFTRWYRNVPLDNADYLEPTLHGELVEQGPGTANAATYVYAQGMALKNLKLDAPLESKITATMTFCARDITDPVLVASRVTGPSTARRPMAAHLFQTASGLVGAPRFMIESSSTNLTTEVNSWSYEMEHGVTPRQIQGQQAAADMDYGKIMPKLTMEIYYNNFNMPVTLRANDDCWFDACMRNSDGAFHLDVPRVGVRGGSRTYPANQAVMCSLESPGFRNLASLIAASMSVFAYHP